MKKHSFWVTLATLGPVGYTFAPGTIATMLTVPFVYWMRLGMHSEWHYAIMVTLFFVFSFICIEHALIYFSGQRDPSAIVLDECLGVFLTFYAIPPHLQWFIVGFLLFRALDILKPFGIRKCEMFIGAWGVMLDDILAGLITNIILCLSYHYFPVIF
jgi:phosphatidylglycerophosphatase A